MEPDVKKVYGNRSADDILAVYVGMTRRQPNLGATQQRDHRRFKMSETHRVAVDIAPHPQTPPLRQLNLDDPGRPLRTRCHRGRGCR